MAWHEDERFWAELRESIFDPQRLAAAHAEVAALLQLLRPAPGSAVLDIPCGPGRHLVRLAACGMNVTGVDLNAAYLVRARAELDAARVGAELVRADMRWFSRRSAYDLALNLYTSFGYFADARDDEVFLRNVHASLRDGGRFVMELLTRETVGELRARPAERRTPDGGRILEWVHLLQAGRVLERRFCVERGSEQHEFVAAHRLYSVSELARLLAAAGFSAVSAHGDFQGGPFTPASSYAVLVATRGAASLSRARAGPRRRAAPQRRSAGRGTSAGRRAAGDRGGCP